MLSATQAVTALSLVGALPAFAQLSEPFASSLEGEPVGSGICSIATSLSHTARVGDAGVLYALSAANGFVFNEANTLRSIRFYGFEPTAVPLEGFVIKIRESDQFPSPIDALPGRVIFEKIVRLTDPDIQIETPDTCQGDKVTQYTVDLGVDIPLQADALYFFSTAADGVGSQPISIFTNWFHLSSSEQTKGLQIGTLYNGFNSSNIESDVTPIEFWQQYFDSRRAAFQFFSEPLTQPCPADLVPPFGVVDLDDLDEFIDLFLDADPSVDFVEPFGIVDLDDLDVFVNAFVGGCP
ncbi:MAG: GC-type dockerin domain-anchored protein [Planctomycetota bacterium]